jgi:hypothetical protein
LSALAVVGAAVLVVPFIGPLVGMVLAGVALSRITESRGKLAGHRLASATLLVGAVLLLAEGFVLERWVQGATDAMEERRDAAVRLVFAAHDEAGAKAVLAEWSTERGDVVRPEAILDFAAAVRDRYGALSSVSWTGGDRGGWSLQRQVITFACVFRFERGDRLGSMTLLLVPATGFGWPQEQLVDIAVEDKERGQLLLSAGSSVAPAPTAEAARVEGPSS